MILVPQESNGSEKGIAADELESSQSQLKGGSIVRYSKHSSSRWGNGLSGLIARRLGPIVLSAAAGYGICYAGLKGEIDSMQREVSLLEAFKKNAERDPASKEFECSQHAAILVKENGAIYEDLKKACMTSPK